MRTALPPLLSHAATRLLDALLPGVCALCGGNAGGGQTCQECHDQFFGQWRPRCRVCANPLPEHAGQAAASVPPCGRCLAQPPAFDATVAAADYALPLDTLVLQLKFGGRLALAALFGRVLADAALATPGFARPALLCPVPLGPDRLAGRGFNQALEIARPLARRLDVALHPRLASRSHETAAQSLTLPSERRANIAHAFTVADGALIAGRHIGVVDDVMTSGQTLNELAATFKRYGAARVTCLVFARTPPH
jgi:ComF family protein